MICKECGKEFPHKTSRLCSTCLPRHAGFDKYREQYLRLLNADVEVQLRKNCELCAGTGSVNETPVSSSSSEEVDCPRCTGTGTETEWVWLAVFAKLLERTELR